MEIIIGVERRRRWQPERKLEILAELEALGVTVAEVAWRHEVSRGLLWQWRAAQRRGELVFQEPTFLPLRDAGCASISIQPTIQRWFSRARSADRDRAAGWHSAAGERNGRRRRSASVPIRPRPRAAVDQAAIAC